MEQDDSGGQEENEVFLNEMKRGSLKKGVYIAFMMLMFSNIYAAVIKMGNDEWILPDNPTLCLKNSFQISIHYYKSENWGELTLMLDGKHGQGGGVWRGGYYASITPPIAPGRYNFSVSYDRPGAKNSYPISWVADFRYYGTNRSIYLYNTPYNTLSFGQTATGVVIIEDLGQTRKLEKIDETDNQVGLPGDIKYLKVRVTGAGEIRKENIPIDFSVCLLYTSPSPRDLSTSRMPSSA